MNENNWITEELQTMNEHKQDYEELPSLILEEGKIVSFSIEEKNQPFDKWTDPNTNTIKKIIPVIHNGMKKNLWLNVKNPLYREILEFLNDGRVNFSVFTTGKAKDTRYTLVKD